MFIQTENTPNPNTLKFLPGQPVMSAGVAEFKTPEEAAISPVAEKIFELEGVVGVFYGSDFVSVSKDENVAWDALKSRIMAAIMDHYVSGLPLFQEGMNSTENAGKGQNDAGDFDDEITQQIVELIETRVRPAVAQDGGDIEFERFEQGVVYLKMRGACAGCPSATVTLKQGIEGMLRHFIPEVLEVRQVAEF
ncbi:MAG: NifU family protein [Alphaproteobacteria bacterium]|nr:NifU family protein [Alphaproteobacteria bacterium]